MPAAKELLENKRVGWFDSFMIVKILIGVLIKIGWAFLWQE